METEHTFPIPQNFKALIKSFSRELLRHQPEDIYTFGYEYFLAMEQGRPMMQAKRTSKPESAAPHRGEVISATSQYVEDLIVRASGDAFKQE
jgi:hypothetical protein